MTTNTTLECYNACLNTPYCVGEWIYATVICSPNNIYAGWAMMPAGSCGGPVSRYFSVSHDRRTRTKVFAFIVYTPFTPVDMSAAMLVERDADVTHLKRVPHFGTHAKLRVAARLR
jgi:hypothetical protein